MMGFPCFVAVEAQKIGTPDLDICSLKGLY